jgi:phage gpG-like protein
MSFTIKIDDKDAKTLFKGISERAANPIEANKIIANILRNDVLSHIATQDGDGKQWEDLKPKTWEWKRKHGYTNMLVNTGNLRRRNIPKAGKDYALVYNDLDYAVRQNNGDKNLPARPWMWLSDIGLKKITKLMANYIVRKGIISDWT